MATIRQVTEGLQILMKYSDPDEHNIKSTHDEIFGPDCRLDDVSEEDRSKLVELGWEYSNGLGCWRILT